MFDVLIVPGHQPWSKGAANFGSPNPLDDIYEWDFNSPLVHPIVKGLNTRGISAGVEEYSRTWNETRRRWYGVSKLLVELHCNAFNGKARGCTVAYAKVSELSRKLAMRMSYELSSRLGNRNRGAEWKDPASTVPFRRRGTYLLYGIPQHALIAEPFFIDNDKELANAQSKDMVSIYVDAIESTYKLMEELHGR